MHRLLPFIAVLLLQPVFAQPVTFAGPTDPNFCQSVQQFMANTTMKSDNTLFTDMPEYRHSKPMVDPLQTFQVVSYAGTKPIMVSCKVKGAAHIRSAYGEQAAGEQLFCPDVARALRAKAVAGLKAAGLTEAAAKVAAFVIDNQEPFMTGRDYLADFELSYLSDDGAVHIQAPGLFHDYDSWMTWILPEKFEGQAYCHLATPAYLSALALGEIKPGTVMSTGDDAPVTPQR